MATRSRKSKSKASPRAGRPAKPATRSRTKVTRRRAAARPRAMTSSSARMPPSIKSADRTHDSTPTVIDSALERKVGLANPTKVAGGGRP